MASKELYLDCATAMLNALTEAGIPADIQELLVRGDVSLGIAPGALSKAAKASSNTILAALQEPNEVMTGSVRHIMMWLRETRPTEKSLLEMCDRRGVEPPDGCGVFDHVPSKAAQAYWIWQEMLNASPLGEKAG